MTPAQRRLRRKEGWKWFTKIIMLAMEKFPWITGTNAFGPT